MRKRGQFRNLVILPTGLADPAAHACARCMDCLARGIAAPVHPARVHADVKLSACPRLRVMYAPFRSVVSAAD